MAEAPLHTVTQQYCIWEDFTKLQKDMMSNAAYTAQ